MRFPGTMQDCVELVRHKTYRAEDTGAYQNHWPQMHNIFDYSQATQRGPASEQLIVPAANDWYGSPVERMKAVGSSLSLAVMLRFGVLANLQSVDYSVSSFEVRSGEKTRSVADDAPRHMRRIKFPQ